MTIKQLQYFLSVCRTQNMTRSAEELFVSQPTLSVAIKELESEAGSALFHRQGNRIFLTEAGKTLQREASAMLAQFARMEELVHSGELEKKYIRIGFSTIVGNLIVPVVLNELHKSDPDMDIRATEGYGGDLLQQLEDDQLDAVLTGAQYSRERKWKGRFAALDISSSRLCCCVGAGSPLSCKESVSLKEIGSHPLVMLSEEFPIARRIEENFRKRGIELNIVLRTSQMFTAERFAAEGFAAAFLPLEAIAQNHALVPLNCPEMDEFNLYPVKLYWKESTPLALPLQRLLACARNI